MAVLSLYQNETTEKAKVRLYFGFFDALPVRGNKWFKLKYNLEKMRSGGYSALLTFGGAYSNHLFAASEAGKIYDFRTVGVVRGERVEPLNEVLSACEENGMSLHFVSRTDYRKKNEPAFLEALRKKFGNVFILPEGGSNAEALRGTIEIYDYFGGDFDYVCLSAGTGGTAAGLALSAAQKKFKTEVFSSLKNGSFLLEEIESLQQKFTEKYSELSLDLNKAKPNLHTQFDFGGYAKCNAELMQFIETIRTETGLKLDKIYTAKMFYGVLRLLREGYFAENAKILVLLTRGDERLS
jgi:1-aminocyclopropane-1-carboxylate deaminase